MGWEEMFSLPSPVSHYAFKIGSPAASLTRGSFILYPGVVWLGVVSTYAVLTSNLTLTSILLSSYSQLQPVANDKEVICWSAQIPPFYHSLKLKINAGYIPLSTVCSLCPAYTARTLQRTKIACQLCQWHMKNTLACKPIHTYLKVRITGLNRTDLWVDAYGTALLAGMSLHSRENILFFSQFFKRLRVGKKFLPSFWSCNNPVR